MTSKSVRKRMAAQRGEPMEGVDMPDLESMGSADLEAAEVGEMAATLIAAGEWPGWVAAAIKTRGLPTDDLPDEVVGNPFMVAVSMLQDPSDPRVGAMSLSLNFAGRHNKALTAQEIEYVVAGVRYALESLGVREA